MSNEDYELLRVELRELREMVESALAALPTQKAGRERADDLVDARYVAELFGCTVKSVREGKSGTRGIRWVTRRPLKARRADVHAMLRPKPTDTPKERTLRLLERRGARRKKSAA